MSGGLKILNNTGSWTKLPDPPADNPYLKMSASELIERGRAYDKRLAEANAPNSRTPLITKVEDQNIRAALQRLNLSELPESAEARKLLISYAKHDEEGKRASEALWAKAVADDADGRKEYAKLAERLFLNAGRDITITTSGPKATTLTLRYVLINRPAVHLLLTDGNDHESDFVVNLRKRGFTKIVLTDGYDKTWTYTLQSAAAEQKPEKPAKPLTPPAPRVDASR